MKNILFATSEAVPFIKTGGLADVAGSLPKYFDKRYFDIRVILPKYACMKQEWKDKMNYITHFYMDLGYKNCYVGIMHMEYEGIQFYFIDNEYYFSGPKPYDGGTWDLEKFAFFSKAVLSVLPVIGFRPDIIQQRRKRKASYRSSKRHHRPGNFPCPWHHQPGKTGTFKYNRINGKNEP